MASGTGVRERSAADANALTSLDEVIVCVAAEEAVGEEGDDGVDCRHVQYSEAVEQVAALAT